MPRGICKLCLKEAELQDSHFLPKRLYAAAREHPGSHRNPNPLLISSKLTLQTSYQIKALLLCAECEERFNNWGERWTLRNCFNSATNFPLYMKLIQDFPLPESELSIAFYSAANVYGIEHLIYFAMSVFWRAAIHQWQWRGVSFGIDLGPYTEKLREFLLDEGPFPANIHLSVTICTPSSGQIGAYFPRQFKRNKKDTYHSSEFFIPGIHFVLYTGQRIPEFVQSICVATSSTRPITVSDELIQKAFQNIIHISLKSTPDRWIRAKKNLV